MKSEETQDYVRESLATSQEEADDIRFVPSALSEPRGAFYWCDNRCSDKTLRYMQTASMVIDGSVGVRTINLCQRCYNEKLVEQGKQSLKSKECREAVERKAHRGKLWKIFGSEQFLRGMWEYFTLKRTRARKTAADAAQEKREGMQGHWQQESFFKEVLEQVKRSADTDCNAKMLRRAYNAKKLCNWESFKKECKKEGKPCGRTIERLQEAYDKVALEDIVRLSIAHDILRKGTDLLRRIIAPGDGMEGVTLSYVCPHCTCFPLDDNIWWVSTEQGDGNNRKKKHCNWWCAACGGQYECRAPNRILVVQI